MTTTKESQLPVMAGLVTISRAAEMLGVTRQTAHDMANQGKLRAWRVESAGSQPDPVVVDLAHVEELRRNRVMVVQVPV